MEWRGSRERIVMGGQAEVGEDEKSVTHIGGQN